MSIRLVARCLRGLESVVAAEILRLGLGTVTEMSHREVHFHTSRPDPMIIRLRTADDVFLLARSGPDIGSGRASVAALAELAADLDAAALCESRRLCGGAAGLGDGVEVSASFLGRRNFNRYDVEDAVGRALAERTGLAYLSRRNGNRPTVCRGGWRVGLDGRRAQLLLRVAERPLHRRAYKRQSVPGSLHPPLAAAMAQLADIRPGHRVLDPCCGAGTLLIEAAHQQADASYRGFDLDPVAVSAARSNALRHMDIERADAADLPIATSEVDRILCNPPWGEQVPARGLLATAHPRLWSELHRVLESDGVAVVLIPDTRELRTTIHAGLVPTHVQQLRVAGRHSYLTRLTPVAHTHSSRALRADLPGGT
ncbi:methyltransferase domain-containing protein [Nocardia sp. CDC159]|uniref:Methyltransferase domain-containing protein n=1 Tax=Nocardia pulmonis TaxID=2951408 RepID=A0A9X2IVG7_9NOCA|nr:MULTISPECIES: methyltransferase domain-containing protein [Nocardia]MCM6773887.1 methyltransferase domain-containing protein [Nocardia pulmonis]MCM6786774.1 methyltransferase domain-containing protein [Nocardia sp. CDC159]